MATEILNRVLTFDMIYPVGSLYFSTTPTSPTQMFGGTWTQIKGQFIYACEDSSIVAGSTGGAKQVSYTPQGGIGNTTLTVDQIPSHNHLFTGNAVNTGYVSADHTHYYTDYYSTTTGGTAITAAQMPSHRHLSVYFTNGTYGAQDNCDGGWVGNASLLWRTMSSGSAAYNAQTGSAGSNNGHSHSGANAAQTLTTSGITANHCHSVTASGSIGNQGGGGAHNHTFSGTAATINTMPPYLAVYVWKRTA